MVALPTGRRSDPTGMRTSRREQTRGLTREVLRRGAADREPVHAQGRLADPDRHALAILAAGADTVVELQIVADHRHLAHRVGTVADQGRALDRRADLALFD